MPRLSGLPRWSHRLALATLFALTAPAVRAATPPPAPPPAASDRGEADRAFLEDGPGWLLSAAEEARYRALDAVGREAFRRQFLADPGRAEAIRRRQLLVRSQVLSLADPRAKLLFLLGEPQERLKVDCAVAFKPIELWTYRLAGGARTLILYRPDPTGFRLWLPSQGKEVLYTEEMLGGLEEGAQMGGRLARIDRLVCPQADKVDAATGQRALGPRGRGAPDDEGTRAVLRPPEDLAAWAAAAAQTPIPTTPPELPDVRLQLLFPAASGLRISTRMVVEIPPTDGLKPVEGSDPPRLRLSVEGVVERNGEAFDSFQVQFEPRPPAAGTPLALVVERLLRPGEGYVVRLRVRDDTSGAEALLARGFAVPRQATPVVEPALPEAAVAELGDALATRRLAGKDDLKLVPPREDVVFGLWRVEAVVSGERIQRVAFLVGGTRQVERSRPPWTAELRLPVPPEETTVRAEGYDAQGKTVATDEVVLNQPRGELRVQILEPRRGTQPVGPTKVRAELVVPEGRRVERLEFRLNDKLVETRTRPPWEATVDVGPARDLRYLTTVAILDDGSRGEDVRLLSAPGMVEQVNVSLTELYVTVQDSSGHLVPGLGAPDFALYEDGRPQKISRFEAITNIPITVGILLDVSGSMTTSLGEARQAAADFLEKIVTPRDQCFAVAFADQPRLVMPRTSEPRAVEDALGELHAEGSTALYDALVEALYYFRGSRGRKALVLLSDGDDTSSQTGFREALEFARRSGVAIYTIGLRVGRISGAGIRGRLEQLAEDTGGQTFFVSKAAELAGVYTEIDRELRSQYLVAFASDRPAATGYRKIEVKVQGGKLKARTARGYYP